MDQRKGISHKEPLSRSGRLLLFARPHLMKAGTSKVSKTVAFFLLFPAEVHSWGHGLCRCAPTEESLPLLYYFLSFLLPATTTCCQLSPHTGAFI